MAGRNFTPFPVLQTERLTLRQLVSGDANDIFALRSNAEVNKYLDRKPSQSIDDAMAFIQTINENIQANHSIYWAITLSDISKLIGTICLFGCSDDNLNAEIGYELLPEFNRKGIMLQAASQVIDFGIQQIGLNSIEAYTHPENHSSTRLLEKLNFKKFTNGEEDLVKFIFTSKDFVK